MSAAAKRSSRSVEEYLAGELASPVKHEYVAGVVYAVAGARNQHHRIAGNIFARLHARLAGQPCQPWNSDTKIRVRLPTHVRFYYPDASVVCQPNPEEDSFQDQPVVIVEVLTRKTRRVDTGEKKDAYLTIPTLGVYLLVESDTAAAVAWRRTDEGFVREVYDGLGAAVPLPEVAAELKLGEVYEGVVVAPKPGDDIEPGWCATILASVEPQVRRGFALQPRRPRDSTLAAERAFTAGPSSAAACWPSGRGRGSAAARVVWCSRSSARKRRHRRLRS